jgi:hypothetical protein
MRIHGQAHHAVHNVPLARLVFVPKDDGGLERLAVKTIEASNSLAGRGVEAEWEHGHISTDGAAWETVA